MGGARTREGRMWLGWGEEWKQGTPQGDRGPAECRWLTCSGAGRGREWTAEGIL